MKIIPFKKRHQVLPRSIPLQERNEVYLAQYFHSEITKWKRPVPLAGIGFILGITILGTGLPFLIAWLMQ